MSDDLICKENNCIYVLYKNVLESYNILKLLSLAGDIQVPFILFLIRTRCDLSLSAMSIYCLQGYFWPIWHVCAF